MYLKQIRNYKDVIQNRPIKSIFFGGGTPSLMEPYVVKGIIDTLAPRQEIEITLEANPTSIETQKFKDFKDAGVNRISIGIQALNDKDLKFLGRTHSAKEALQALEIGVSIFDNVSFDLIYARPGQTLEQWAQELEQALSYDTKHLSLYQLTIEENTPFYQQHKKGYFHLPNDDVSTDQYLLTSEKALEKGLAQYEVSNYAKPGYESQHNLSYWNYRDYLGIGPGAHSRLTIEGEKWGIEQIKSPSVWLKSLKEQRTKINDVLTEKLMMGLRLKKGIPVDFEISEKMQQLIDLGLLQINDGFLSATDDGFLKLNGILRHIL